MTRRDDVEQRVEALTDAPHADLLASYRTLFGREPHNTRTPFLRRRVAWGVQARAYGGLSVAAQQRLEQLIEEVGPLTPTKTTQLPRRDDMPSPGTVLTRRWHDRDVEVRVLDNGFEYEGQVYRSLSAVAQAVTGSHWSGPAFFGLTPRKRAS